MSLVTGTNDGGVNHPTNTHNSTSNTRNQHRNSRNKPRWNKGKQNNSGFTSKTREMNGHVFQLQAEQKRREKFQETLDQLHIYASSMYKKDIMQLKILFTELKQPELAESEIGGNSTPIQQAIFKEEVRQYAKDKKSLETTLASLYNVIWGQCSKLLQNKLKSNSKYSIFNNTSDVSTLLTKKKELKQ